MKKRPTLVLCVCWGNREIRVTAKVMVRDRIPFSCLHLFLLSHVGWQSASDGIKTITHIHTASNTDVHSQPSERLCISTL